MSRKDVIEKILTLFDPMDIETYNKINQALSMAYGAGFDTGRRRDGARIIAEHKRVVEQYDLNREFIESYDSIREASAQVLADQASICRCIKGKARTAGGFIWKHSIIPK